MTRLPSNKRRKRVILLLTAMALLVVFIAPPMIGTSPDPHVRVEVARAILERGEVSLPEGMKYDLIVYPGRGGRNYGIYGIGQSLVFLPLDAIAKAVSVAAPADMRSIARDALLAGSYMLLVNVALAMGTFLVMRQLRLSTRMSCVGTLVVFVGSQWLVWSKWLHEETLAATLLLFAAYLVLSARNRPVIARAIAFGACAGLLANVRLNAAFAGLAVLVWGLWQLPDMRARARFFAVSVLAIIPWLTLLAGYNNLRFENVFETGYGLAMKDLGVGLSFDAGRLSAITIGPDCGLIWFGLPLIFLTVLMRGGSRSGARGAGLQLAALGAHIFFLACFVTPAPAGEDGYCGPRYLAHNIIALGPFCWLATRRLWIAPRLGLLRWAAVAIWCASVPVQTAGVILYADLEVWQNEVRYRAGQEKTTLDHYVVGRAKNLARLFVGSLRPYTFAEDLNGKSVVLPVPEESLQFSMTPHFLPWRISGSGRTEKARSGLTFWGLTAIWGVVGAGAGALTIQMARRRKKIQNGLGRAPGGLAQ